jgi:predicted DCC family thiol-disulfide oxidoreductase YuxK
LRAAGAWVRRRRGRLEVLYDGQCGLCGRTVRILRGLDLLERLVFVDFRRADMAPYA